MLLSHRSTLQRSVPMLSCHVHPECPWPGFLIRSSQTDAHGFCSPPNQEVMSKYILWLLRSCFAHILFPSSQERCQLWHWRPDHWMDDIVVVACPSLTVKMMHWFALWWAYKIVIILLKNIQMPFMASQSYLDTHLLESLYREATFMTITLGDLFVPGGQATWCQDTTCW